MLDLFDGTSPIYPLQVAYCCDVIDCGTEFSIVSAFSDLSDCEFRAISQALEFFYRDANAMVQHLQGRLNVLEFVWFGHTLYFIFDLASLVQALIAPPTLFSVHWPLRRL